MKIPKDYIAIPVTKYDIMMRTLTSYEEQICGVEKLILGIHEEAVRRGYLDKVDCKDVARVIGLNLDTEEEDE